MIKKDLPDIAKHANVSIIVGDVLFSGDDVELVDITEQMCAPFAPDARTVKAIRELIVKPVVPQSQLSPEH